VGRCQNVDARTFPPLRFVTDTVDLAMMPTTERYGELVADLEAETAYLCEAQMMGVAGQPFTNQAGLLGNKSKMALIATATGLGNSEQTLVDFPGLKFFALRDLFSS
jgi:hypothetical protein